MPWEIDTESLDAMGEDYLTASNLVTQQIEASAHEAEGLLAYSVRGDIMEATPVGKPPEVNDPGHPWHPQHVPGALRRSTYTTFRVFNEDRAVDVELVTTQEEMVHPNLDGSGGGYDATEYILRGRDAITAPSYGHRSTGKLALLTPWGPRRYVASAEPAESPSGVRPYPKAASTAILTASALFTRRWGTTALAHIGEMLGVAEAEA